MISFTPESLQAVLDEKDKLIATERARADVMEARLAECRLIMLKGGPSMEARAWNVLDVLNSTTPPPILAELERLRECLHKANESSERFEREWYLRGDALEAAEQECERLRSELNAAKRS